MIRNVVAGVALGALLGGATMMIYQGPEIERLAVKVEMLKMQYEELKQQSIQKSGSPGTRQEPVVQEIDVEVKAPDALSSVKVAQFVKRELSFLTGVNLQFLMEHPQLPLRLLENRSYSVDQQIFTLHVNTVVIGEILYLRITAMPQIVS